MEDDDDDLSSYFKFINLVWSNYEKRMVDEIIYSFKELVENSSLSTEQNKAMYLLFTLICNEPYTLFINRIYYYYYKYYRNKFRYK